MAGDFPINTRDIREKFELMVALDVAGIQIAYPVTHVQMIIDLLDEIESLRNTLGMDPITGNKHGTMGKIETECWYIQQRRKDGTWTTGSLLDEVHSITGAREELDKVVSRWPASRARITHVTRMMFTYTEVVE